MKTIHIPYGKTHLELRLPPERLAGVLSPSAHGEAQAQETALVSAALEHPIHSPALKELAQGKQRVLIITSDHTRPMPSQVTIPLLLSQIREGNPSAEIRILISTGTHRPMREDEMLARFGEKVCREETLINHLCDDAQAMIHKGTLPSGGALWLNNLVDWADLLIAEGFVEPHFFAGFSGGRKSVLPGIASRATVLYNHNAGFIDSPQARQGSLEGNPLHRDMLYASEAAGLRFILNVLLDENKRVVSAYAGDPTLAHEAACEDCLARTSVRRIQGDIAITSNGGYPLDQNVYQSVKGMTAAEACVRQGGVIILCAALGEGAGGEGFFQLLRQAQSPQALLEALRRIPAEETLVDQWEAQIWARVMTHATVLFVTGPENRRMIQDMGMRWMGSLEDALNTAYALVGEDAKVVVIPDGPGVIVK